MAVLYTLYDASPSMNGPVLVVRSISYPAQLPCIKVSPFPFLRRKYALVREMRVMVPTRARAMKNNFLWIQPGKQANGRLVDQTV